MEEVANASEGLAHPVSLVNVGTDELDSVPKLVSPSSQVFLASRAEVVDHNYGVPQGTEILGQVRTNKSRASGHCHLFHNPPAMVGFDT
jgi:hypothetical protein